MRDGKLYSTLVMALLAVGLVVYFGVYVINSLYNPFSTTIAYTYTLNDSAEVEGILIREEYLLPQQTGIVESLRREGERAGSGQAVALVHRDAQAQANQAALDEVENEISVLYQVLSSNADVLSASHQDEAILQSVVSLRQSATTQSFSQLDQQVVDLKSQVLQRDYAYSGVLTQEILLTRLSQLQSQQSTLSTTTASATQTVYAPITGLYSSNVDGFETLLTPSSLADLTEAQLQQYLSLTPEYSDNLAGKLILGSGWYLALSVPTDTADGIRTGDLLTVRFGGEFAQDVTMTVTQVGSAEGDSRLMVLFSDRYASDTTLLRQTWVELIYGTYTGLRIPKAALRMEGDVVGVYTSTAGRAEFKPVTILAEGGDFYVVSASTNNKTALRAGDEVIVYATGLYDGKLLD